MEIFLVGGAVRDFIRGKLEGTLVSPEAEKDFWSNVEKDWVVVGSTPQEMRDLGYRPVGKSFPVFLHPKTKEEYALARTERKIGKGYTGFECYAGQQVTLEEDLRRRDLTINAMALPQDISHPNLEQLIDPYGGVKDLQDKVLRHVSPAFIEDPVRILRIARFAARFGTFKVAPATQALMIQMVEAGEIDALVAERVWQEWSRSLAEDYPWRFHEILGACGALPRLFPEAVSSPHKKDILEKAVLNREPRLIRFAIQLHDINENQAESMIEKYRMPGDYAELLLLVSRFKGTCLKLAYTSEEILNLFEKTDAFRKQERFKRFLVVCTYLDSKKTDLNNRILYLEKILQVLLAIKPAEILSQGFKGAQIGAQIRELRLQGIERMIENFRG